MSIKTKLSIAFLVSLALMGGLLFVLLKDRAPPGVIPPERTAEEPPKAAPVRPEAPAEAPRPAEPAPAKKKVQVEASISSVATVDAVGGWVIAGRIVREVDAAAGEAPEEPVAGVMVHLKPHPRRGRPEHAVYARKVVTGPDGLFELRGVPAAVYLRLEIDEPSSAYRTLSFQFSEPQGDSRKDLGDVLIEPGGTIRIHLVGPRGEPVEKGSILVNKASSNPGRSDKLRNLGISESRREAQELGKGEYILERAPLGELYAEVKAPGYTPSPRTNVTLPADEPLVIRLQEGVFIAGTVLSTEGKAIENAELEVNDQRGDQKVRSGADGRFVFDTLAAGDYTISANADGFVNVRKTGVSTGTMDLEFRLAPEAVLSGKVIADEGERAIAKARVTLRVDQRGGGSSFNADSNAEGAFSVRTVAAGTYTVTAEHPDFAALAVEEPRELAEGQTVSGIVLRLQRGLEAAGKVVDGQTQEPIADAQVTFQAVGRSSSRSARTAKSGADGSFEIKGLGEGSYDASASVKGYFTPKPQRIAISAGGDRTVTIALEAGSSIAGRVMTRDGQPIRGATIRPTVSYSRYGGWNEKMNQITNQVMTISAQSDAEGRYRLEGLPPNDGYAIGATHRDYAPRMVRGLSLKPREALEDADIQLTTGGSIRGRILDENGKGIAGADVNANADRGGADEDQFMFYPISLNATSDQNGAFSIAHVEAGSYSLNARTSGRAGANRSGVSVAENRLTDGIDLVLGAGEVLAGRVVDPEGKPVAGAQVQVYGENYIDTRTDADGRFEAKGLDPQAYTQVNISMRGYASIQQQVTVPAPETVFKLERSARVSGRLKGPEGTRYADFRITWIQTSGDGRGRNSSTSSQNDANGQFEIELGPGTYQLVATVPGFAPSRSEQFVVKAGDRVEGIEIPLDAGAVIEGVVVLAATGEPVDGARINLQNPSPQLGWVPMPGTTSDGEGKFTIDGVPSGTLSIQVSHSKYAAKTVGGIAAASGSTARVRVELTGGGSIRGLVSRQGQAVSGVRVNAWKSDGVQEYVGKDSTTKPDGTYEINGLPPGEYSVGVIRDGRGGGIQNSERATVFEGQATELNFDEDAGIRLTGRVLAAGNPVSGGRINAMREDRGFGGGSSGEIDGAGNYSIELPGPATYSLMVEWRGRGRRESGVKVRVTIPPGASEMSHDIELPTGTISGVVVDAETGQPVPNAQIVAFTAGAVPRSLSLLFNAMQSMAGSDGQGRFSINNLAAGEYSLRIFAMEGFAEGRLERIEVEDGAISEGHRVALGRGIGFSAQVVDGKGQPVAGAMGLLRSASGELVIIPRPTASDAEGKLEFSSITPGVYRVTAIHPQYAAASATVRVEPEVEGPTLTLRPGGKVLAAVVDRGGQLIEAAEVQILDEKGENVAEERIHFNAGSFKPGMTAKNGSATFDQLPPGTYRAVATKGKARSRDEKVTVAEGQSTEVRLTLSD